MIQCTPLGGYGSSAYGVAGTPANSYNTPAAPVFGRPSGHAYGPRNGGYLPPRHVHGDSYVSSQPIGPGYQEPRYAGGASGKGKNEGLVLGIHNTIGGVAGGVHDAVGGILRKVPLVGGLLGGVHDVVGGIGKGVHKAVGGVIKGVGKVFKKIF